MLSSANRRSRPRVGRSAEEGRRGDLWQGTCHGRCNGCGFAGGRVGHRERRRPMLRLADNDVRHVQGYSKRLSHTEKARWVGPEPHDPPFAVAVRDLQVAFLEGAIVHYKGLAYAAFWASDGRRVLCPDGTGRPAGVRSNPKAISCSNSTGLGSRRVGVRSRSQRISHAEVAMGSVRDRSCSHQPRTRGPSSSPM